MQRELQKSGREQVRRHLAGCIAAIENRQPRFCNEPDNAEEAGNGGGNPNAGNLSSTGSAGQIASVGPSARGFNGRTASHVGSPDIRRVALGIKEIDEALDPYHGKGIEYAGLHEIRSQTTLSFAAAAGFALALGNHMERSRFQRVATFQTLEVAQSSEAGKPDQTPMHIKQSLSLPLQPIVWIADRFCRIEAGDFYGPGLYPLGIEPGRLIRVLPRNFDEAIWAAGEVAKADRIGFGLMEVRGNPHKLDLAMTRRLGLRCQKNHVPFFILRQAGQAQTSAVSTRWLVEPALSQNLAQGPGQNLRRDTSGCGLMNLVGMTTWNVSLEKCRGGKTGDWRLEWNHHEQAFQRAGQSFDQSLNPATRPQPDHHQEGQPAQQHQRQYSRKPVRQSA